MPVLTVDPGDSRPAYRQIADTLAEMIRSGQASAVLEPGRGRLGENADSGGGGTGGAIVWVGDQDTSAGMMTVEMRPGADAASATAHAAQELPLEFPVRLPPGVASRTASTPRPFVLADLHVRRACVHASHW